MKKTITLITILISFSISTKAQMGSLTKGEDLEIESKGNVIGKTSNGFYTIKVSTLNNTGKMQPFTSSGFKVSFHDLTGSVKSLMVVKMISKEYGNLDLVDARIINDKLYYFFLNKNTKTKVRNVFAAEAAQDGNYTELNLLVTYPLTDSTENLLAFTEPGIEMNEDGSKILVDYNCDYKETGKKIADKEFRYYYVYDSDLNLLFSKKMKLDFVYNYQKLVKQTFINKQGDIFLQVRENINVPGGAYAYETVSYYENNYIYKADFETNSFKVINVSCTGNVLVDIKIYPDMDGKFVVANIFGKAKNYGKAFGYSVFVIDPVAFTIEEKFEKNFVASQYTSLIGVDKDNYDNDFNYKLVGVFKNSFGSYNLICNKVFMTAGNSGGTFYNGRQIIYVMCEADGTIKSVKAVAHRIKGQDDGTQVVYRFMGGYMYLLYIVHKEGGDKTLSNPLWGDIALTRITEDGKIQTENMGDVKTYGIPSSATPIIINDNTVLYRSQNSYVSLKLK